MKARLLADADLHPGIVRGTRARSPEIDFMISQAVLPVGTRDRDVLAFAAEHGRVVVSHDVNTMPRHFRDFTRTGASPGLILIPQRLGIGTGIEELLLVWECNDERDFRDQVLYLPL